MERRTVVIAVERPSLKSRFMNEFFECVLLMKYEPYVHGSFFLQAAAGVVKFDELR